MAGKCDTQSCSYLLLGSDSREGLSKEEQIAFGTDEDIGGENRSDTIVLVHTEPRQRQAVFLSFPRDLWVGVPVRARARSTRRSRAGSTAVVGDGRAHGQGAHRPADQSHPLRGSRAVPGAGRHARRRGHVRAVPDAGPAHRLDIEAGCQRFDGATALAYVRTRHQVCDKIPDFARIGRQQQFLRAVISKLLSPSELLKLPALVRLVENFVVDPGLANPAELRVPGRPAERREHRRGRLPLGPDDDRQYLRGRDVPVDRPCGRACGERPVEALLEGKPLGELGKELPQTPRRRTSRSRCTTTARSARRSGSCRR